MRKRLLFGVALPYLAVLAAGWLAIWLDESLRRPESDPLATATNSILLWIIYIIPTILFITAAVAILFNLRIATARGAFGAGVLVYIALFALGAAFLSLRESVPEMAWMSFIFTAYVILQTSAALKLRGRGRFVALVPVLPMVIVLVFALVAYMHGGNQWPVLGLVSLVACLFVLAVRAVSKGMSSEQAA